MAIKDVDGSYSKEEAAKQEMLAGAKAAQQLQSAIKSAVVSAGIETVRGTGNLMKTSVKALKDKSTGQLDRITIYSPRYSFMLNYGFEGIKSNGIAMNLGSTNHLHTAINETQIVNNLANEIGDIRADQVSANINF